jgi:hypothetical protein
MVRTPGFHPGNRGSIPRSSSKLWLCLIMAIILDCLSGDTGSIPVRVAKLSLLRSSDMVGCFITL